MSSTAGATKQLTIVAALTAAALLTLVAGVLLVRRLSGALEEPLGGAAILATALISGGIAACARLVLAGSRRNSIAAPVVASLFAVPGIAALGLLAALTLPGTSAAVIVLSWFGLATVEAAAWLTYLRGMPFGQRQRSPTAVSRRTPARLEGDEFDEGLPAGLVQQVTRVRLEGGESIHALVAVNASAHDRPATFHLAFCPPLEAPPALTAHVLDGEGAEARVTRAETFGARVELDWKDLDEPRNIVVEVLGTASISQIPLQI